jgi:nitroimidazol reductase NimA-like FMN-containing flavoprotein (pyridoxamine 5'-phosphate oxidase superfamily)
MGTTDDLAPERGALARAIIAANLYLTLGTADASGRPWASPVYYGVENDSEFFWVSAPEATHSRNIASRPEVGIVIFDSQVPIGTGQAVYMTAIAAEHPRAELERGLASFSRRSVAHGGRVWSPADVLAPARHRVYRAQASEHFVLDEGDSRVAVPLPSRTATDM